MSPEDSHEINDAFEADDVGSVVAGTKDPDEKNAQHGLQGFVPAKVNNNKNNAHRRPFISYELAVWLGYGIFTLLAIYDRFDWNVWPRQTFHIGQGKAGSDRLVGYKEGPWSVVAYDVIARISGRYSILAYNLLLFTRMRFIEHYLLNSWINKSLMDCSNIVNANLRLHKWNGIALCILTLIHVWSILLPCVTHKWKAQVIAGTFEWFLSERKPPGFKDANPKTETMSLQVDDAFRLVEMTILLGILAPLSVKWLASRWHAAIQIHRFMNVIYFVDIVRRHTHPHSWVLNTPVFILWLMDKAWSNYFRRHETDMKRVKLGQDYMVLYWKHPFVESTTVGPDFFLKEQSGKKFESAHVFTTFKNRTGFHIGNGQIDEKHDKGNDDGNKDWSFGAVIRVFRDKRTPQIAGADTYSHTMKMFDVEEKDLAVTAWGPNHGEMSELVKVSLVEDVRPIVLIGAGSGINYIVDALQWIVEGSKETSPRRCKTTLLFSTRDIDLFNWVDQTLSSIVEQADNIDYLEDRVRIVLALTGSDMRKPARSGSVAEDHVESVNFGSGVIHRMSGRISFGDEIPEEGIAFAQGSQGMKESVATACRQKNTRFYGGLGGRA